MEALFDEPTAEFLETGCALLVATATGDGAPVATRGWGCRVLERGAGRARLRVLLARDDPHGYEHAAVGDRVAVTATSVRTLRSVQLKGRIVGIEPATGDDEDVGAAYREGFFRDINDTDGTPFALLERSAPTGHLAWLVEVDELFDQTPGPEAGRSLQGRT